MTPGKRRKQKKSRQRAHQLLNLICALRAKNKRSNEHIAKALNQRNYPPPAGQSTWSADLIDQQETWAKHKLARSPERKKKNLERALIAAHKLLDTIHQIRAAAKNPDATTNDAVAYVLNKVNFPLPSGKTSWTSNLVKEKKTWAKQMIRSHVTTNEVLADADTRPVDQEPAAA